jgi:hypothetical protein
MRSFLMLIVPVVFVITPAFAVPKSHVIAFGKWQAARWLVGASEENPVELKIRPLFVDAKLREYTTGLSHEVTERLFVVRRVFHLNDSLPDDKVSSPRWLWQRGGWLLVDRLTGRISPLNLADFDTYASGAAWYRDYIAYCGVSEDGAKLFAVVMQLGRRKPILHKLLGDPEAINAPDSACALPVWQRQPSRVSFIQQNGQQLVFSVRRRTLDIVNDTGSEDEDTE